MGREEQEIENHEGVISFAGVVKKPVMVDYTMFSNSIRYGVAKAIDEQHPYYFAAHGYPCRNDDDYTIARLNWRRTIRPQVHVHVRLH